MAHSLQRLSRPPDTTQLVRDSAACFCPLPRVQQWLVATLTNVCLCSNSLRIVCILVCRCFHGACGTVSADLTTVLKSNALEYTANGDLAVLVVDNFTLRVLTSCLTMDDILAAGYAGTVPVLLAATQFLCKIRRADVTHDMHHSCGQV